MIIIVILFILLSPGFLVSIPAIGGKYLLTGKTNTTAVLVHALIFGIILYFLRNYYPTVISEGFTSTKLTTGNFNAPPTNTLPTELNKLIVSSKNNINQ